MHIAQWGTYITTRDISASSATVNLAVDIENKSKSDQDIQVVTEVYDLNDQLKRSGKKLSGFPSSDVIVPAGEKIKIENSVAIKNPMLWGLHLHKNQICTSPLHVCMRMENRLMNTKRVSESDLFNLIR